MPAVGVAPAAAAAVFPAAAAASAAAADTAAAATADATLAATPSAAPAAAPTPAAAPAPAAGAAPATTATVPLAINAFEDDGGDDVVVKCVGRGGPHDCVRLRLTRVEKRREDVQRVPGALFFCAIVYFDGELCECPLPGCSKSYRMKTTGKDAANSSFRYHITSHFACNKNDHRYKLLQEPIFVMGVPDDENAS